MTEIGAPVLLLTKISPEGNHTVNATYTPGVNYFVGSTNGTAFDSRGYTVLDFSDPLDLDPDRRTIRGDNVTVALSSR